MKRLYYRRSPHVVAYWDHEGLVLENYLAHTRVGVDPVAALVLSAFDRWMTADGVLPHFPEYEPASVRESVRLLARHKFLERSRGKPSQKEARDPWREWTPTAAHFHFSTKDSRFLTDLAEERRFYRNRARAWPVPSPLKTYPRARQISLPPAQTPGEFCRVLHERRTWRRFSAEPVALSQVATLLRLTWGVQGWMRFPILGRLARKTSPSGGARHPIEAYVAALRVKGLAPGIYHYATDSHRLERIRRGVSPDHVQEWLGGQHWFRDAAAVFLMTAVFPRTQWKYPSARTYRVVLADAGHLGQTFCLAATWLGLAPFCTMALAESKIEKSLGVDGYSEAAIYATGVGLPPEDGRDAGDLPD